MFWNRSLEIWAILHSLYSNMNTFESCCGRCTVLVCLCNFLAIVVICTTHHIWMKIDPSFGESSILRLICVYHLHLLAEEWRTKRIMVFRQWPAKTDVAFRSLNSLACFINVLKVFLVRVNTSFVVVVGLIIHYLLCKHGLTYLGYVFRYRI